MFLVAIRQYMSFYYCFNEFFPFICLFNNYYYHLLYCYYFATSAVVWVVDSVNFPKEVQSLAHLAVDMFTHPAIIKNQVPFLIACNKQGIYHSLGNFSVRNFSIRNIWCVKFVKTFLYSMKIYVLLTFNYLLCVLKIFCAFNFRDLQ